MVKNARKSSICAEKILGIVNVYGKNARNRQCVRKIYSGSSMCTGKMLGIVNVKWEMLGIVNAKWGNALKSSMQDERLLGNRQYVRKKYSEISTQGDTMLKNANVR